MEVKPFEPYQYLAELSSYRASGVLKVAHNTVVWYVYFLNGELQYLYCSASVLAQIRYMLSKQGLDQALTALKEMPIQAEAKSKTAPRSEHEQLLKQPLDWLINQNTLNEVQTQHLLVALIQDSMESLLWLRQAETHWEESEEIPPWLQQIIGDTSLIKLPETLQVLQKRLKGWQNCCPELWSPYQRPYLLDVRDINKPIPGGRLTAQALSKLAQVMSRGLSLRQLSIVLKKDELQVAQLLNPYISEKLVFLRNPKPPFDRLPGAPRGVNVATLPAQRQEVSANQTTFKIVCIDDSAIILSEITNFLSNSRYSVTTVDDPIQAASTIFRVKPDLILLDINMPKINGYNLCSLLRNSNVFNDTPIIMVTGNTGIIEKAGSKLAGATDYLMKPFSKNELTVMFAQYALRLEAA